MIDKLLNIAYNAMVKNNTNMEQIVGTPFNLVKLDNNEFGIVIGNTMLVKSYINELSDNFEDNFYNTLFGLIDMIVEFKINNKEVNNEQ